jgi:translation initiation factor 1
MAPNSRTVYTTQSGRVCPNCGKPSAQCSCKKKSATTPAGDGVVRVGLEKKGRGGKTVSVISGITLSPDALRDLASDLKRRCGTGGTVKDGVIEIQGDHRDTLIAALKEHGYSAKRVGG